MNPNQPYYQVKGQEVTLITRDSSNPAISSDTSLQLKPEKGNPPPQTPSRTENSEKAPSSQLVNDAIPTTHLTPTDTMIKLPEHTQSALDEAIEEAKAIQDLVSLFTHRLVSTNRSFNSLLIRTERTMRAPRVAIPGKIPKQKTATRRGKANGKLRKDLSTSLGSKTLPACRSTMGRASLKIPTPGPSRSCS